MLIYEIYAEQIARHPTEQVCFQTAANVIYRVTGMPNSLSFISWPRNTNFLQAMFFAISFRRIFRLGAIFRPADLFRDTGPRPHQKCGSRTYFKRGVLPKCVVQKGNRGVQNLEMWSPNLQCVFAFGVQCRPLCYVNFIVMAAFLRQCVQLRANNFEQESPAVADKSARRLRKVCTVYVRAVGL